MFNTSNADTAGADVVVGEQVIYNFTVRLPEGTTSQPNVDIRVPVNQMTVLNAVVSFLPANFINSGCTTQVLIDSGATSMNLVRYSCGSIVNVPDNVFNENDSMVITVTAVVLTVPSNMNATRLTATSQLTYSNGASTVTESLRSVTVSIVQPILQWTVSWNMTSCQAGDVVEGTLEISHGAGSASPGYEIIIVGKLRPYYNLISSSVVPSDSSAYPVVSGIEDGYDGIIHIPSLRVADTVTVKFSTVIDNSAMASSTISNVMAVSYWTSPANSAGRQLYLFLFQAFVRNTIHLTILDLSTLAPR